MNLFQDTDPKKVKEELADIFCYALLLSEKYHFDVATIVRDKIQKNGEKYPVAKAEGNARKYNELYRSRDTLKHITKIAKPTHDCVPRHQSHIF